MTSVFPFALLLCLSSGLLAAYGQAPCPPDWTQFGSRCFAFYIQTKTWIDAETFCQTAGGNLASIHSAEEHKFIKDFIKQVTGTDREAWIGGSDAVKGAASCPPGWRQFGSRCFAFYIQAKTWIDAETFCQTAGGNLASIHSAEEHQFLKDLIYQVTGIDTNAWIGGFDSVKEGTWLWTDGSKFNYRIFNVGQPDNDDAFAGENCLEMNFNGNNWNDRTCSTQFYFVCSKNLYV